MEECKSIPVIRYIGNPVCRLEKGHKPPCIFTVPPSKYPEFIPRIFPEYPRP